MPFPLDRLTAAARQCITSEHAELSFPPLRGTSLTLVLTTRYSKMTESSSKNRPRM
jgi:hypothetical protein